jgi:hypothetical protein
MKITVTEQHIEQGKQASQCFCPVALAIREATGIDQLCVLSIGVIFKTGSVNLPEEASNFVLDFDAGQAVEPFEFELPIEVQT